jgi:inner membrane protein
VIGPLLVVPYTDYYEEQVPIAGDAEKRSETVRRAVRKNKLVFPNTLKLAGSVETERRYRGIHQVLVYSSQHALSGDFVVPDLADLARHGPDSRIEAGAPFVALSVADVRGIRNIPRLNWGGQVLEFEQGTGLAAFSRGLHATLPGVAPKPGQRIPFAFDLGLDGIEGLSFVPVGRNNDVALKSNWPHPQFGGRFLPSPKQRRIDQNGFSANWSISALASDAQQQLATLETAALALPAEVGAQQRSVPDSLGVRFIEPVNIYSQVDRAIKYGLLFVALTFAAFFIFELLKQLPIHPVQYLLVGLALVMFFLLLLALSEHIAFVLAYLIASGCCIVLTGFYLAHVLQDVRRGLGFGCALTLMYGAVYGLLSTENMALVLGSVLLFAVLATIMVVTRKVDWYRLSAT